MDKKRNTSHLRLINCEPEKSKPEQHPAFDGPTSVSERGRLWGGVLSIRLPEGVLPHPSFLDAAKGATNNIAKADVLIPKVLFTFGILGKDRVDANINITRVTDAILAAVKLPLDYVEREFIFARGGADQADNHALRQLNHSHSESDSDSDPPPVA